MKKQLGRILVLLLIYVSAALGLRAQDQPVISGDFRRMPFENFVQALEQKTSFRFFYSPIDLDSF
jgi:hypothetical protein